jgi:uncharacterized SAM-binding protein YcdF (DUF218 family)
LSEFLEHPQKPERVRAGRKLLVALIILACALPLVYLVLWGMGGLLIVADPFQKANAVVVLSGNETDRLKETLRILREGYAPLVVITETEITEDGSNSMSTIDKVIAARQVGIASEAILVTNQVATSTRDEALAVLEVAQQRNFKSVIVVTDPYHCFRTRVLFRGIFKGSGIEVIVRPVRDHWYRSTSWWLNGAGRRATFSEYAKLFFFLFGIRGD